MKRTRYINKECGHELIDYSESYKIYNPIEKEEGLMIMIGLVLRLSHPFKPYKSTVSANSSHLTTAGISSSSSPILSSSYSQSG